jgi:intein/homing endonuclease
MTEIEDLADNPNIYIKLNKEFVRELLGSISNGSAPRTSVRLADLLGVAYNHKYCVSPVISNWLDGKRAIPIKKLKIVIELSEYSWENVSDNLIALKGPRRNVGLEPKFPIRIDGKLGSIVGHILGDGSIDNAHRQISFSNTNKQLLDEFRSYMKDLFGIEPRIWAQKKIAFDRTEWLSRCRRIDNIPDGHNGSLFYPTIISEILYVILGEFAKGKFKKVPDLSFNASDDYKIGLIRAFFDDEGHVGVSSYSIRVFQDCRDMLEDMMRILKSIGIEPNSVCYYVKRGKKRFYFNITSYENLKRFRDVVGFTSTDKSEKLDMLVERINNSRSFRLGHNQSKELILSLLRSKCMSTKQLQNALKEIFPRLKWNRSTLRRKLNDLSNRDTILKIRRGKNYFWTYSEK